MPWKLPTHVRLLTQAGCLNRSTTPVHSCQPGAVPLYAFGLILLTMSSSTVQEQLRAEPLLQAETPRFHTVASALPIIEVEAKFYGLVTITWYGIESHETSGET
jgi:hypothetical protein